MLVYGNLIAESTLLFGIFKKEFSNYHIHSLLHISKTIVISIFVLSYELLLNIPEEISFFQGFKFIFIQLLAVLIGFYFLKESVGMNVFLKSLKKQFNNTKNSTSKQFANLQLITANKKVY